MLFIASLTERALLIRSLVTFPIFARLEFPLLKEGVASYGYMGIKMKRVATDRQGGNQAASWVSWILANKLPELHTLARESKHFTYHTNRLEEIVDVVLRMKLKFWHGGFLITQHIH